MKKYLILTLLIFTCQMLFSQSLDSTNTNKKTKAILFNFDGFNLSSLAGGIGSKIWLSNTTALKSIINLQYNSDNNYTESVDHERSSYEAAITFYIEKHLKNNTDFSPYFVLGTGFSYLKSTYIYNTETAQIYDKSVYTGYGINGSLGFGLEYYILKNVSLSGEYSLYASYKKGKTKVTGERSSIEVRNDETRIFKSFIDKSSGLILSIYF